MKFDYINEYVRENEPNICQICVLIDGKEVFSEEWNGYNKTDCTHIMSATKSIVSLLIGIAIDKEMIKSVNERVMSFFPDYIPKRGEKTIFDVTLKHLLTMRAPYKGKGDMWTKVCKSENWTFASLDFLGGRKGITNEFDYRTVCLHILSGILYRVSGMRTVDFANKYLFSPLGIPEHVNYYALSAEEHKRFTIEKMPKENIWFSDPDGIAAPGYGLCLSASDMAKIGQLCLNKGTWNGERIISEKWITEMTVPRDIQNKNFRGMKYGFLWWIIHPEKNIYAAVGNSGNVIYVNPAENIVVAVSSYFKPTVFDRVDFIENVILPYFKK